MPQPERRHYLTKLLDHCIRDGLRSYISEYMSNMRALSLLPAVHELFVKKQDASNASYVVKSLGKKAVVSALDLFHDNAFANAEAVEYVTQQARLVQVVTFGNHTVQIITPEPLPDDKIQTIVDICTWMITIAADRRPVPLRIFLFMVPHPKLLPTRPPIEPKHVNSGVTVWMADGSRYVAIWRTEELHKVLIHELIHLLELDAGRDRLLNKQIDVRLGSNDYPVIVNEAITEVQAQLLHTVYACDDEQDFVHLYLLEHLHSIYQCRKVLRMSGVTRLSQLQGNNQFDQTTNAFSYYVLKAYLTLRFDRVLPVLPVLGKASGYCTVQSCPPAYDHVKNMFTDSIASYLEPAMLAPFDSSLVMCALRES